MSQGNGSRPVMTGEAAPCVGSGLRPLVEAAPSASCRGEAS